MAAQVRMFGQKARRGERMTKGKGWRLAMGKRRKQVFVGTLLDIINLGDRRLAVFSVPN